MSYRADEVIFLIGIAKDLSLNISEPIEIFEDNSSAKVFVRFRLLMLFFVTKIIIVFVFNDAASKRKEVC